MKRLALTIISLISFTLVFGGGYAYYVHIPDTIEQKVIFGISAFDFERLTIGSIEKKSGSVVLSDIALDNDRFSTIENITVRFDPLKFVFDSDHALTMSVNGMKLTGEITDSGDISVSGFKDNQKILTNLYQSHANLIRVENSTIDLLSDTLGGISIRYNGQILLSKDNQIELRGQAQSKQKNLTFTAKINGTTQDKENLVLNAEADQVSITLPHVDIKRAIVKAQIDISERRKAHISVDTEAASINWYGLPLRDIKMNAEKNGDEKYKVIAEGNVYGTQQIEWSAQITHDDDGTQTHSISVSPLLFNDLVDFLRTNHKLSEDTHFPLPILNFENPNLSVQAKTGTERPIFGNFTLNSPFDHFNINGEFMRTETTDSVEGTFSMDKNRIQFGAFEEDTEDADISSFIDMAAKGAFKIHNLLDVATLEWDGTLSVSDGILQYGTFETPGIKGDISYNSKTRKYDKNYLTFTMPLPDSIRHRGRLNLLLNDSSPDIFQTQILEIYGGSIKTEKSVMKDVSIREKNKLLVSDINLSWLFEDAGFSNITIWGEMGGVIPYELDGKKIKVDGGILQSQSSGIIKLPDSIILSLFPGNTPQIRAIRAALKNYHYEYFEIRLDGDISDRVLMTLNATGYNPDISKDPVDMNLQIETQISLLFKNLLRAN